MLNALLLGNLAPPLQDVEAVDASQASLLRFAGGYREKAMANLGTKRTHRIHGNGIFLPTLYHKNQPNVRKYTIHGSYGVHSFEKKESKKSVPERTP